ncbi:MAG TPA: hypothetical protein VJR04_06390 [Terriglobales bacterium]|nr:hypothetical protein [Terriglobales bacterium]
MTRTTRHLPVLLLALVVICSTTLAAEEGHNSYSGQIGMLNPCNGAVVIVSGMNFARVHENSRGQGEVHVSIHLRFTGDTEEGSAAEYRTILVAKGEFKAEADSYDIPYRSLWVGRHGAPSFSMDGTLTVWVQAGVPQSDQIQTFKTACRANARLDDLDDHDRGDHDRDDHDRDNSHNSRGHDSH